MGKRLNDQVTLIASQNLRDSELAWIVDYLPHNNIELRELFSGENDRAYEFRHALELGAPPPRGDSSALDQRLAGQLRVASVEFSASPASRWRHSARSLDFAQGTASTSIVGRTTRTGLNASTETAGIGRCGSVADASSYQKVSRSSTRSRVDH